MGYFRTRARSPPHRGQISRRALSRTPYARSAAIPGCRDRTRQLPGRGLRPELGRLVAFPGFLPADRSLFVVEPSETDGVLLLRYGPWATDLRLWAAKAGLQRTSSEFSLYQFYQGWARYLKNKPFPPNN